MSKSKHVYVIYIQTTAEKVWQAITEPKITRQYWGYENVTDWKPNSKWEHQKPDTHDVMLVGKVVEVTPPNKIVITWADPSDANKPEKHSRVIFDLKPVGDMVKLTVTHDELEAGSDMDHGINEGWPRVLSGMKTFLETGRVLNIWIEKEMKVPSEA